MLAERVVEWTQEWKREGLQEGLQKGVQKGEANLLKRLLVRRFGDLPSWVEARLGNATTEELEQWGERLLEAASLEEIFDLG